MKWKISYPLEISDSMDKNLSFEEISLRTICKINNLIELLLFSYLFFEKTMWEKFILDMNKNMH